MLCPNCSKLASLQTKKTCIRCQGAVFINIGILCDLCSRTEKKCAVCVKTVMTDTERAAKRGCNCGSK